MNLYYVLFFIVESPNNGVELLSPPHNSAMHHKDSFEIQQPSSTQSSPVGSPSAMTNSLSFTIPPLIVYSDKLSPTNTGDPNWQATRPSVRERNALMFNNELMADVTFLVGCDGKYAIFDSI